MAVVRTPDSLPENWLRGRASLTAGGEIRFAEPARPTDLPAKCRGAYRWLIEQAIYAPYYDVEYGNAVNLGSAQHGVRVADGDSYVSFALLPLLALLVSGRVVLVGAPGRGKTTMATLMALLAGGDPKEVRRSIQHGHPQLTQADLLGSPLPRDLVKAEHTEDIRVVWRRWISHRVKVIDEYNRIPTKTQSCLLSLMAEGYAEMYEQVHEAAKGPWYLTANGDQGGGTFPVISALKDRIDLVVRCTPYNAGHLERLAERVAHASSPEDVVPRDVVFTGDELDTVAQEIRRLPIPSEVLELLGFLLEQLDFCRRGSDRLEYQNKDTLHLAGRRLGHVCNEDCPLDKFENLCTQAESGVSVRAYKNVLLYARALAYFRGRSEVGDDDVRQILPWVLHEKLRKNPQSAFFQKGENEVFLTDQLSWIRQLYDTATAQYTAYRSKREYVRELVAEIGSDVETSDPGTLHKKIRAASKEMDSILKNQELNAPVHHDLLALKQLLARCRNRLSLPPAYSPCWSRRRTRPGYRPSGSRCSTAARSTRSSCRGRSTRCRRGSWDCATAA